MAYQKEVRNAADWQTTDIHCSLFAIGTPLCYTILQSALFYHQHSFIIFLSDQITGQHFLAQNVVLFMPVIYTKYKLKISF